MTYNKQNTICNIYLEIGSIHLPLLRKVNALIDIPTTCDDILDISSRRALSVLKTRRQCSGKNLATSWADMEWNRDL